MVPPGEVARAVAGAVVWVTGDTRATAGPAFSSSHSLPPELSVI